MLINAMSFHSAMNPRRVTLAIGGLLAVGYLSTAAAYADDYIYYSGGSPDPVVSEEGFPPLYEEISGPQLFNVADATTQTPVGTFEANSYAADIPSGSR